MRSTSSAESDRRRYATGFPPNSHSFRPTIDPRHTSEAQRRQIVWLPDEDDDARREHRFELQERKRAILNEYITCPNTRFMLLRMYVLGETCKAEAARNFLVNRSTIGHWMDEYFEWLRENIPPAALDILFDRV